MEVAIIRLICAFLAVLVPAQSFIGDKFDPFSEEESVSGAEMYSYLEKYPTRMTREAAEHPQNRRPHHTRRNMFPDYKHCCGGENIRNRTTRKIKNKAAKLCADKVNANLKEWEKFANPIKDQFSCEKLETLKNRHYCFADCMMKEIGVLNGEDRVQTEKAKEFMTSDIAPDWLKEVAEKAVDKCVIVNEYEREKLKCNPRAVILKHCVWKEIVLTCPEEHFEKSEYCLRVKKSFEEMNVAV